MANEPATAQEKEDALVDMIDQLIGQGSGHLTISSDSEQAEGLRMETFRSMDCSKGNMACAIPNMPLDNE